MLRGYESRRQLQCVGSTQPVNTKKPYRCLSDSIIRINLVPSVCKLLQPSKRERHSPRIATVATSIDEAVGIGAGHRLKPRHVVRLTYHG